MIKYRVTGYPSEETRDFCENPFTSIIIGDYVKKEKAEERRLRSESLMGEPRTRPPFKWYSRVEVTEVEVPK